MHFLLLCLSGLLFCFSALWNSYLGVWISLEMALLMLMPCFFYSYKYKVYLNLMSYLVMSSLGSISLVSGLVGMQKDLFIFLFLCLKVGIFPFYSWYFLMAGNMAWSLIFKILVISKLFLLNFYFVCMKSTYVLVYKVLCLVSFMLLAIYLWTSMFSVKSFYMVSKMVKSINLMYIFLKSKNFIFQIYYFFYVILSTVTMFFFSKIKDLNLKLSFSIWSLVILLSVPVSLYIMNKLIMCFIIIKSLKKMLFLFGLVVYSMVEQVYLTSLVLEKWFLLTGI